MLPRLSLSRWRDTERGSAGTRGSSMLVQIGQVLGNADVQAVAGAVFILGIAC